MTIQNLMIICVLLFSYGCQAAEQGYGLQLSESIENDHAHALSGALHRLLPFALSQEGIAYQKGGTSPESGFDCSGFVRYVFDRAGGLSLPHGASAISKLGDRINLAELRPGDLVFFHFMRNTISHVGIYLGNNQFIHASSSRTGDVMVSNLDDHFWSRHFTLARRLVMPDKPALGLLPANQVSSGSLSVQ